MSASAVKWTEASDRGDHVVSAACRKSAELIEESIETTSARERTPCRHRRELVSSLAELVITDLVRYPPR